MTEAGPSAADRRTYAIGIGPVVQAEVLIDDYLVLTVAQADVSQSGTVHVSVEGRAV